MNRPAYGASRSDDTKNPLVSSAGPWRTIDPSAPVRLVYAYMLLYNTSCHHTMVEFGER